MLRCGKETRGEIARIKNIFGVAVGAFGQVTTPPLSSHCCVAPLVPLLGERPGYPLSLPRCAIPPWSWWGGPPGPREFRAHAFQAPPSPDVDLVPSSGLGRLGHGAPDRG